MDMLKNSLLAALLFPETEGNQLHKGRYHVRRVVGPLSGSRTELLHSKNRNAVVTKSMLFHLIVVHNDPTAIVTKVLYNNIYSSLTPWEQYSALGNTKKSSRASPHISAVCSCN